MITVNTREEFLIELKKLLPYSSNLMGCEIGVLGGDFSKMILDIIVPMQLVLIDPYSKGETEYDNGLNTAYSTTEDYEKISERFKSEILNHQIVIHTNFSYKIVNKFKNEVFNFVYHDASHLFIDLKRDLNDWLPKLKSDAIMCGHDYVNIGGFGVIEAVDDFCKEHNYEMILFNENGGDWALQKKKVK